MMLWPVLMATFAQTRPVDVGGSAHDALEHSTRLYAALLYGVVVLLVLAFGCWALLRASRRYKERLRRKPAQPTSVPDVWSMHQLPDSADTDPEPAEGEGADHDR